MRERFNEKGEPFCPNCGFILEGNEEVSNWWYLLPLLFGVIGGLVAFALTLDQDEEKAKNFVKLGLLLTIAFLFLYWLRLF